MKHIIFIFIFILIANSSTFAFSSHEGCEANGFDYAALSTFIKKIKFALKNNDARLMSTYINYPLRINLTSRKRYLIKNKSEFLKQYASLFPKKARESIIIDSEIFCNYQGSMLSGGYIWFDGGKRRGNNEKIKIFLINRIKY